MELRVPGGINSDEDELVCMEDIWFWFSAKFVSISNPDTYRNKPHFALKYFNMHKNLKVSPGNHAA